MTKLIERIEKMEKIMNEVEKGLAEFDKDLENFEETQKNIKHLEEYYFSGKWQEDKKSDEEGKLPDDMPTGVLSQDGIWNLSVKNKELGLKLIKLGVSMIE